MSVAPTARRVIPIEDWRTQWHTWVEIRELTAPDLPPFSVVTMRKLVELLTEHQALFRPWQNEWNEIALAWRTLEIAIDHCRHLGEQGRVFNARETIETQALALWVIKHIERSATKPESATSTESAPEAPLAADQPEILVTDDEILEEPFDD